MYRTRNFKIDGSMEDLLHEFAEWVALNVCREDFEERASVFAEICCRKLNELEIVSAEGDVWRVG